jgi:general stress protein 26
MITKVKMMEDIAQLIARVKTGVLATVDDKGQPHMRWMTPAVLSNHGREIYAITSPEFAKAVHLHKNPKAEWMFQDPALLSVINIRGKINLMDNASLKNQIIEMIGRHLNMFWKQSQDKTDFLVLEMIIDEARYYHPMEGIKETVAFN